MRYPIAFAITVLLLSQVGNGQTSQPAPDAVALYDQAGQSIVANSRRGIDCPRNSNDDFPNCPPFPPTWLEMEKKAFEANANARAMARRAASAPTANWPAWHGSKTDMSILNDCRCVSNELTDAAIYQHINGDDVAALVSIHDIWRLADQLENPPNGRLMIRLLVSVGIRAEAVDALEDGAADMKLTIDPADKQHFTPGAVRELIPMLLAHLDGKTQVMAFLAAEGAPLNNITRPALDRIIETDNRINAERDMAAMILACHLYRFEHSAWPASLDDIRPYLSGTMPIDPWGDGKQTLGYVLILHGLPDDSDRPLIYSRCRSKDGLFYRTDAPQYGFYIGDGSNLPADKQKQGGQFRDVTLWTPPEIPDDFATTRPLPTTNP